MNPLQQYRHIRKLSQAELALILGVSQPSIALIEKGKRKVSTEKAVIWSQIIPEWDVLTLRPDLRVEGGFELFRTENAA